MTATTGRGPTPVRFAQRADRTLIAGLSAARAVTLAVCILTVAAALVAGGAGWGMIAAVGLSPLAGSAMLTVEGKALLEWTPIGLHHLWRGSAGQLRFLAKPGRPKRVGTLPLPADAARLMVLESVDGSVIIRDPYRDSWTVIASVHGDGFLYADGESQDAATSGWGRALAAIAADGQASRIQLLHTTRPDDGTRLRHDAIDLTTQSLSTEATNMYRELLAEAGPWWRHETLLAITLSGRGARAAIRRAGHGLAAADRVLAAHRQSMADSLTSAGVTLDSWLTPVDLAGWVRRAYDPACSPILDSHPDLADGQGAGPVAVQETWAALRTDSAWHTVMWINQWPRADTHPAFLATLILPAGVSVAISLLYEPIPTTVALRQIGRDKTAQASDMVLRRRFGRLDTAAQQAQETDTAQREADITAGHLDMRHTGFIAVTADSREGLADAVTRIRQASAVAGCDTRTLYGQQLQAFHAAALPLTRGL